MGVVAPTTMSRRWCLRKATARLEVGRSDGGLTRYLRSPCEGAGSAGWRTLRAAPVSVLAA